jgi:hypothetical protein
VIAAYDVPPIAMNKAIDATTFANVRWLRIGCDTFSSSLL